MTTENRIAKRAETKAIVEPRLQVSREKLKRISDRSLARYLSAAEKLKEYKPISYEDSCASMKDSWFSKAIEESVIKIVSRGYTPNSNILSDGIESSENMLDNSPHDLNEVNKKVLK